MLRRVQQNRCIEEFMTKWMASTAAQCILVRAPGSLRVLKMFVKEGLNVMRYRTTIDYSGEGRVEEVRLADMGEMV